MIAWIWTWGPVLAQMAAIFVLSGWSDVPDLPAGLSDYSGHFIGYAVLGALALRGFARATWSGATVAAGWRAVALSSLYGATDELHQTLVPDRTATVSDWVTDTAGAIAGVLLCLWAARLVRARGKPRGV